MRRAAEAAGKSEVLARYAADYPQGPHDQPQSMCPAFGSLRVGLRMKRTATVLSGSACCVYGLTFTSHFYGARRSVGYVPFNSETLVTGKLFEDIREAVYKLADPENYDAIVVTNLCVPTASGVPLRLLPKAINGVRIIGIDVPGFGIPTHAEAKDVLAGAMLAYAREEVMAGPVAAPDKGRSGRPSIALVGEMFPADPVGIGALLEPLGLSAGPVVPTREWRELYAALDCAAVAAIHPFYKASLREFEAAGRPIVGSGPVGVDGTAAWLDAIGRTCGVAQDKVDAAKNRFLPAIKGALAAKPIKGRITVSGYEGSELLVARLLVESGADVLLRRHGLPAHALVGGRPRVARCPRHPGHLSRLARAGPRRDGMPSSPTWRSAPRRWCRRPRPRASRRSTFTNLISARPLFGMMGAGSLAEVVNAAIASKPRFDAMKAFFEGVGTGHTAGVWQDTPVDRPEFREKYKKALDIKAKQRAAETQDLGGAGN